MKLRIKKTRRALKAMMRDYIPESQAKAILGKEVEFVHQISKNRKLVRNSDIVIDGLEFLWYVPIECFEPEKGN